MMLFKYYSLTEHLAVDEIILLFKGRVVFKQYISKEHKCFGMKIYKLCDLKGYTYDMGVYVGKDRTHVTHTVTAAHANTHYCGRTYKENSKYKAKLYMDNFFLS
jgi:hypothetical protein